MAGIVLQLSNCHDQEINKLEGNTYQVHVLPGNRIMLSLVELADDLWRRCPFIVGGERCGREIGHQGKHMWARGD